MQVGAANLGYFVKPLSLFGVHLAATIPKKAHKPLTLCNNVICTFSRWLGNHGCYLCALLLIVAADELNLLAAAIANGYRVADLAVTGE